MNLFAVYHEDEFYMAFEDDSTAFSYVEANLTSNDPDERAKWKVYVFVPRQP